MKSEWALQLRGGLYFREMTNIGPRCTNKVKEAARFSTMKAAKQHEAYSFPLTAFEPVKIKKLKRKVKPEMIDLRGQPLTKKDLDDAYEAVIKGHRWNP